MRTLITTLVLFLSFQIFAKECEEKFEKISNTLIGKWKVGNKCILHLSPENLSDEYHDYWFTSSGTFMTFYSFYEKGVLKDGSRSYYLLPANSLPIFKIRTKERLIDVWSSSGDLFRFDAENTKLLSVSNSLVKYQYGHKKDFNWGPVISHSKFLLMDAGFAYGNKGFNIPNRKSVLKFENKTCSLENKKLFVDGKPRYKASKYIEFIEGCLSGGQADKAPHLSN